MKFFCVRQSITSSLAVNFLNNSFQRSDTPTDNYFLLLKKQFQYCYQQGNNYLKNDILTDNCQLL